MRSSSRERAEQERQQREDELQWARMALAMEQAEQAGGLDSGGSLGGDESDESGFADEDAYFAAKAAARAGSGSGRGEEF